MIKQPAGRIARIVALLLLIQLLAISGALAQPSAVKEYKLDNGLTVLIKETHAAPVLTAQIWFKVGSRNEHEGITGISHILEHLQFASSKNYPKGKISEMVHERGGIDNAATWTDFTYYWELMSSENLDFTIKTMAERVGGALLKPDEFAKERTVVLSELEGDENDPDTLLYQNVMATAFQASPYHWPTIGWLNDVKNIDRSQLVAYYDAWYHPNNATLVLVGDIDPAKAMTLVKRYFGKIPSEPLPRQPYTKDQPQDGIRTVTVRREGTAERVILGYHVPSINDPDSYPLTVLDQILSGGRSSRLYQALVEKRLATSAWSSAGNREDPSLFMLGATGSQGVTADQLEKALREQVELIKSAPPTQEEMQTAKNQIEADFVYQNDSVSDQGEQLGYYNTITSWHYLETFIPRIKAVTAEQVQAVAKKYFNNTNLTAGKFVPTGPPAGGVETGPPAGPVHFSPLPGPTYGMSFYRNPASLAGRGPKTVSRPVSAAGVPQASSKAIVKPYRVVLDNGMVVIVQENHSNPTVAIAGNMKAGSNFDPAGKDGVASLTASMISRGTTSRTSLQIAKASEQVGANISSSADDESMDFSAKSLTKDFPLVLDLLSDEFRNATFPEQQFETLKGRTLSELAESKESPESQATRMFYHTIYPPGHPYYQPTVAQAQQEVQSITRDDLVNFYKTYYRPDTTIIVIAGDVDSKKAVELVKCYFGDWKASGPAPKVEIPTVMPQTQSKRVVIPMMDKTEVDVIYGYALGMKRSNSDYYAMRIMNQILGGSGALTSVLGEQIREQRGLVYDVRSGFDAGLGGGPWYASLGSNPKNVDQAIDVLRKQIALFKQNGATQKEYEQAREFIIGVFPVALETNAGVARALLSAEFYGLGMNYLRDYAKIYRSVTLQQVNAAARKYLHPEAATLVIAGPYQEKTSKP